MDWSQFPQWFVTALLGAGIVKLLDEVFHRARTRNERKEKLLDTQLRELYAPLFYLVSQSEKLFELYGRFHDAYKAEFIDKKYSDNELTQERLKSWAITTIDVANEYIKQVEANNEKISHLLDSSFSYIDPEDVELFLLFFEHRVRLQTERENGVLKTPFQIHDRLGEISYLRPEFIERVKSKFLSKKRELDSLSKR